MMKYRLDQKRGFTLVELVMVMVIVGLLAAIIVPRFSGQRDQAAIATTKANLENLRTAVSIYYAQEGTTPTPNLQDLFLGGIITGNKYMKTLPYEMITVGGSSTVLNSRTDTGGWFYDEANVNVELNLSGPDANNDLYEEY